MITEHAFDALADRTRRQLLMALAYRDPLSFPLDIPSLNTESDAPSSSSRLSLSPVMYHAHLPKLADYGYIEWYPGHHSIERGPQFEAIEPLLILLAENRDELAIDA